MDASEFHRSRSVPEEGIERAIELMRSGELFRYEGSSPGASEAALLEREFAEFIGTKFALGLNSCSSAIFLALKSCGVGPNDGVLVPAFTFTAVPGAIVNLGARPVLVEVDENYRIDIGDLRKKITLDTRVFLLSHMRGHLSDMDEIVGICARHGVTLIEDAAHSLGARWREKRSGSFGRVGCFSFQSYKMIDSGEGGMLVTNDEETAARAVCMSGCYEKLYESHSMRSGLFERYLNAESPFNFRMTNLTAAIVRPQLRHVEERSERGRGMYAYLASKLAKCERIELPREDLRESRAPDSIQFRVGGFCPSEIRAFAERVRQAGLPLAAIGADEGNARAFWNWRYIGKPPDLPETRALLQNTCDLRLAHNLSDRHLDYIADTIFAALR